MGAAAAAEIAEVVGVAKAVDIAVAEAAVFAIGLDFVVLHLVDSHLSSFDPGPP